MSFLADTSINFKYFITWRIALNCLFGVSTLISFHLIDILLITVVHLSSSSNEQYKSQSPESSDDKENTCMNDAPESIVADRNFLVSDMNDGPESSTIAHNKKDEHDTVITSSENSIGVDAGNAVDSHIPVEGMQFNSEEDAYTFYNEYALRHGFSVRRSSWDKNAQGIIVRKTFVCSKEGWKNSNKNPTSRKPDTRCGCPARMVLRRLPNGKYFVRTFIRDHNHPLASPSTSHLLRSHRKAISSCPATGELTNNAGIAPKKTYKQLVKVNDDHKNVPFIPTNCRNHLRVKSEK